MRRCELLGLATPFFVLLLLGAESYPSEPKPIDYGRDVRPILADACFHCHGPDPENREAGLRLDVEEEAKIATIVDAFRQLGVQKVAPCHCSGDVARRLFEEAYGEDFIPAGVGSRLEVRE